jgi:hypothetical protein
MAVRKGGALLVLTVISAFAGGFAAQLPLGRATARAQEADTAPVLRAGAFVVVDAQGRERATLGMGDDGGIGMILKDVEGRRRLALGSPEAADPEKLRWVLSLHDEKGTYRVLVAARDDGQGCGLGLWDENGTARFGLGAAATGGGFSLRDASGTVRAGIGEGPTGVGISAGDELGQIRIVMGIGPDGTPSLAARDADGNEVWRAPIEQAPEEPLP